MNIANIPRAKLVTIVGGAIIVFGTATAIATVIPTHKTVTISSKNWECVSSDTVGLEARCTAYRMVSPSFSPQ